MTPLLMGLAALAAWLLVPDPPLARLEARRPGSRTPRDDVLRYPRSWRAGFAVAIVLVTALLLPGATGGAAGVVAGAAAWACSGLLRRPLDHAQLRRQLPDALDFLAACLEAGAPLVAAVSTVASVSPGRTRALLDGVLAHMDVGGTAEEAWGRLRDHPVWGPPARDLVRSARSGTGLVAALRLHADDARRAWRDAAVKRARTVGVRSVVPLMACFLPAFVLIGVVPIVVSLLGDFFG